MRRLFTTVLVICLLSVTQDVIHAQSVTISLDPSIKLQKMTGWQAVGQIGDLWGMELTGDSDYMLKWRDEVVNEAVNDLGINMIQIGIKSGDENPTDYFQQYINDNISYDEWRTHWKEAINDNDDPNSINWNGFQFSDLDYQIDRTLLPLKQASEARGEKLYVILTYGGNSSTNFNHGDYPEEYAELIEATFIHINQKYGWVPDGLEIVNEPKSSKGWSGQDVGNAIVAVANRLRGHGFNPEIFAPSNLSAFSAINYFDQLASVLGATNDLDYISYHCYSACGDDITLQTIANRAATYQLKVAETEKIAHTYLDLLRDIKLAKASSWQQFALAFESTTDDGGKHYYIDTTNISSPTVNIGKRTKYLRQYFKFVRSGAQRISATYTGCGDNQICSSVFDPLAFINKDGGYVVIVKADSGGSFAIQGLPAGAYGMMHTVGVHDGQWGVNQPDVTISNGQNVNASIPAAGVITIYAKFPQNQTPTPTSFVTITNTPGPTNTSTPTPKSGDADGDGMVDTADYVIWFNHYDTGVSGGNSVGDFNENSFVDGADYMIWYLNLTSNE
jgi:hypothetical protein